MKAILEFALPDEELAFRAACRGTEFAAALHEIDRHLRDQLKYGELGEQARDALQQARDALREQVPDIDDL